VSTDGNEVPAGVSGEIWLKGPNIFKGYLNNLEGTANAFSSDGYLKTGDIGYVDKHGNFYITDRLKELIKYKGFQVAPAELEGLLAAHPKVNDVAVIGIYDGGQATEIPMAYVVPAQGVRRGRETEKEIASWLAARVAPHKRLRGGVRFVDEIPKSAAGKILRRILMQKALQEGGVNGKAKL
jgi:4-coumarate--CoA ligase